MEVPFQICLKPGQIILAHNVRAHESGKKYTGYIFVSLTLYWD